MRINVIYLTVFLISIVSQSISSNTIIKGSAIIVGVERESPFVHSSHICTSLLVRSYERNTFISDSIAIHVPNPSKVLRKFLVHIEFVRHSQMIFNPISGYFS
ncbi:hypothetical protein BC833DRAFT_577948 [Globomyces pollinis-pini]|nr:hypothetical protein BC833DRAFT_577948 [Globomyces pollinis-pini]